MNEHIPNKVAWDCLACEKPWPCDSAREYLALSLTGPGRLSVVMFDLYVEAADTLCTTPLVELRERFIGWTTPVRRAA